MNLLVITWDPPLGIPITESFSLRFYSLMWAAAFISGWFIIKKIFTKEGIKLELMDSLLTYMIIGVFLGARLGHVFFYDWAYYQHHLEEILLPFKLKPKFEFTGFAGLASHGAAIGTLISMWLFSKKKSKKPILWILDRLTIPVALGGAFVRIGNFINSEIVGAPSDLPWAVVFKQMSRSYGEMIARHPAQLYEAIAYIFLFIFLWRLYWKTDKIQKLGYFFGLFFMLLWAIRFVIEFFKAPQVAERADWFLNTGQLLSIPLILLGFWVMRRAK